MSSGFDELDNVPKILKFSFELSWSCISFPRVHKILLFFYKIYYLKLLHFVLSKSSSNDGLLGSNWRFWTFKVNGNWHSHIYFTCFDAIRRVNIINSRIFKYSQIIMNEFGILAFDKLGTCLMFIYFIFSELNLIPALILFASFGSYIEIILYNNFVTISISCFLI